MNISLKAKKKAYLKKQGHPFERKITHTQYTNKDEKIGKGKWSRVLTKNISDNNYVSQNKEDISEEYSIQHLDNNFLKLSVPQKIMPIGIGGVSFLLFLAILIPIVTRQNPEEDPISFGFYFWMILFFLTSIFFLYYYLTMPYKECIFNRKDSLVTMPGVFWQKNITMHINNAKFIYSSPSAQGMGSHRLQIIRPIKGAFLSFHDLWLGNTYYEDLSFYLWYMDKNRPLPPGTAFDPYRQKDFERRKAEGFPKPMFPSTFETPEATPEQQAERKRIGGW